MRAKLQERVVLQHLAERIERFFPFPPGAWIHAVGIQRCRIVIGNQLLRLDALDQPIEFCYLACRDEARRRNLACVDTVVPRLSQRAAFDVGACCVSRYSIACQ